MPDAVERRRGLRGERLEVAKGLVAGLLLTGMATAAVLTLAWSDNRSPPSSSPPQSSPAPALRTTRREASSRALPRPEDAVTAAGGARAPAAP